MREPGPFGVDLEAPEECRHACFYVTVALPTTVAVMYDLFCVYLPFIVNVIAVCVVSVLLGHEFRECTRGVFKKVATPGEEYGVSAARCGDCGYVVVTHSSGGDQRVRMGRLLF